MNAVPSLTDELRAEARAAAVSDAAPVTPSPFGKFRTWFENLPLGRKVGAIFGTFFAIAAAVAVIVGVALGDIYTRTLNGAEVKGSLIKSAELQATVGQIRYNSVRFIFGGEEAALKRQSESISIASAQLGEIESIVDRLAPQKSEDVDAIKADLNQYNGTFEELRANLVRHGAESESSIELAYKLSREGDNLFAAAGSLRSELDTYAYQMQDQIEAYFLNIVTTMLILLVCAFATLVLGLRYLSRDYIGKIGEIASGMNQLAKGDHEFTIAGAERQDEIGGMVRSLKQFQRANVHLQKWAKERADRADEKARAQEEREKEREEAELKKAEVLKNLATQFERTVGDVVSGVAAASAQLQTTARSMANSADDSTQRTSEVSKSMEEANSGATAAAAASDEFAMSIGEISRQAASSAELARKATDSAKQADGTISALSDSAEQVGQIVELIQTIAQRTNLLALNASIEAARGGEAGRGFAVVASEVKELAMQTSRATDEVAQQIRSMQDSTGASVTALRKIAGQIEQLETTAVSIASAVDQQSVAGQDLARSIDIAATSTDQVSSHITDLRELSLTTGAAASQVLSSATDLENQAKTLSAQADAFVKNVRTG